MAEPLDFAIAQTYRIDGTGDIHLEWDDSSGSSGAMLADSGEHVYFRTFVASNTYGDGSQHAPYELLNWLENQATLWRFTLTATGFVRITYTGTGTGHFTAHTPLCYLLGQDSAFIADLTSSDAWDVNYQPTHIVFSPNFRDDTGWRRFRPQALVQHTANGRVYGIQGNTASAKRSFGLQLHPKTYELSQSTDSWITPVYPLPDDPASGSERWTAPLTNEPAQCPWWSVLDMLNTSAGVGLGIAWGNLQAMIAEQHSSQTETYDECSWTEECITSGGILIPSQPNWDARRDCTDLEVMLRRPNIVRQGF